jgi:3-phosphoshikimate 1-carboxyvinyltransferase
MPVAERSPDLLKVEPARGIRGLIRVPGDKSITHRGYLLGGLARGRTHILNPNPGRDCEATLEAMVALGARATRRLGEVELEGIAGDVPEPAMVLDCGNSGTSMRLLLGILAGGAGIAFLTGDRSLVARPMQRVIEPLERMGARIWSRKGGRAPLAIRGGQLRGMETRLEVASAQVKSAILLAGLAAQGRTRVTEPIPTRDHTERLLTEFGAAIEIAAGADGSQTVGVSGGIQLQGTTVDVPGDPSAAAFYLVAGLVLPDSEVTIERVAMNPTRRALIDALIEMGGEIEVRGLTADGVEPEATVVARSSRLSGISVGGARIPALIDELPILAVAGAYATGTTTVTDAAELRVKESDRIAAICRSLAACGVRVEERQEGFLVHGGIRPQGGVVDALGDHRMAMAMAILALGASGPLEIHGASGIETSFPDFAAQLAQVRVAK